MLASQPRACVGGRCQKQNCQSHVICLESPALNAWCTAKTRSTSASRSHRKSTDRRGSIAIQVQAPAAPEAPPAPAVSQEPIDVSTRMLPIADGVLCLRHVCKQRLKFEVEYALKRGTTDNSYLFLGADGKLQAMLDIPDNSFSGSMVRALSAAGSLEGLNTLIISHLTPKRMDSLKALLQLLASTAGNVDLYLSNPAMQLLRSSLGGDAQAAELLTKVSLHVAKPGSVVTLAGTHGEDGSSGGEGGVPQLRLVLTPTPRWPDMMAVYSDKHKLLFSSKLFSAHVSPELVDPADSSKGLFDDAGWDAYGRDWQYFFDCNMAPVAKQFAGIMDRLNLSFTPPGTPPVLGLESGWLIDSIKGLLTGVGLKGAEGTLSDSPAAQDSGLSVEALCPLHGPVIKFSAQELLRNYGNWTIAQLAKTEECGILVLYASAYGNTAALAQAISRGITKAGVGVEQLNLELCTAKEVQEALKRCKGFCIGSPTLGGHMPTQVQTALGTILSQGNTMNLPAGVFGSFGWSGEAVDEMELKLKDAGFVFGFEAIRCKFKPTQAVLQVCEESGTDLAQMVLKRKRREDKVSFGSSRTALPLVGGTGAQSALGRVVGSLCVVTAKESDAESAMLASWVSQASFDPPGMTIAVKRDRAVEPLLQTGAKFVVNILAEGSDRPILKHLLKPFKPGQDRFEGLSFHESSISGCKILDEAAAYLECEMQDRMEAGDHYILYAKVATGQVLAENALSAVHHRKIGTSY